MRANDIPGGIIIAQGNAGDLCARHAGHGHGSAFTGHVAVQRTISNDRQHDLVRWHGRARGDQRVSTRVRAGGGTIVVDEGLTATLTGDLIGAGNVQQRGPGRLRIESNNELFAWFFSAEDLEVNGKFDFTREGPFLSASRSLSGVGTIGATASAKSVIKSVATAVNSLAD